MQVKLISHLLADIKFQNNASKMEQFDDADELKVKSITMEPQKASDQFDDADGDSIGNELIELATRDVNSCSLRFDEKQTKEGSSIISDDSNPEDHSTLVPIFHDIKNKKPKLGSSVLISNDSPLRNKTIISVKLDNSSQSDESSLDTKESRNANNYCNSSFCIPQGVTENDVLCGRGHAVNSFVGNRRFRDFVMFYCDSFLNCKPKTKQQRALCHHILQSLHFRGGRFLVQDETNNWTELEDDKAMRKVSQLLRGLIGKSTKSRPCDWNTNRKKTTLRSTNSNEAFARETPSYRTAEAMSQIRRGEDEDSDTSADSKVDDRSFTPNLQSEVKMKRSSETSLAENSTTSDNSSLEIDSVATRSDSAFSIPEDVTENDILCGKGWSLNNFIGNRRYRDFAMKFCDVFSNCENRQSERREICQHIVQAICARGGRFLTKDENEVWTQLEEEKAMRKVSQLLRTSITEMGKTKQRYEKARTKKMSLEPKVDGSWNRESNENKRRKMEDDKGLDTSIDKKSNEENHLKTLKKAIDVIDSQASIHSSLETTTTENKCIIGEPMEDDVLYGRGSRLNDFIGNRRYRDIAMAFRDIFANPATRQSQKWEICNHIVKAVHARGGRFLIKDDKDNWTVLEYKKVVKKVNQLLRDNVRIVKKATKRHQEAEAKKMANEGISPTVASIEKKIALQSNTISQELSKTIAKCDRETKEYREKKAEKLDRKTMPPQLTSSSKDVAPKTKSYLHAPSGDAICAQDGQHCENTRAQQLDLLSTAAASIELKTTMQVKSSSEALQKILGMASRQFQMTNNKSVTIKAVSPTLASMNLRPNTPLKALPCNVFNGYQPVQTISPTMASLERKSTGHDHFAKQLLGQQDNSKNSTENAVEITNREDQEDDAC